MPSYNAGINYRRIGQIDLNNATGRSIIITKKNPFTNAYVLKLSGLSLWLLIH
jgi:hypothetical protein